MKDDKKKKKRIDVSKFINLEPTMNEAKSNTAVLTFGRFSPPTVGHEKLVNKITSEAKSRKAIPLVFTSHTFDKKKNPLAYESKVRYLQKAFGQMVQNSNARTIIEVAKELNGKFANLVVVVGSDRVPEFQKLLTTYNGREYNYESIEVISAGDRDPDADDVSGMSASKLRALVVAGDFDTFQRGLPTKLKPSAKEVYSELRKNMRLEESVSEELDEETIDEKAPLTIQQRRQRAMTMKRYASRIARARERAQKKKASPEKLKVRARRKAKEILRQRILKQRSYAELTPSEKIQVDKRILRIPATTVNRIATRQLPAVRKAELERLASMRAAKTADEKKESLDTMFEKFLSEANDSPAKYHTGLAKSTAEKRQGHFEKGADKHWDDSSAYKPAPGDAEAETKPSKYTKKYHNLFTKEGTVKHDRRFKFNRRKENPYFKELEESSDTALDNKAKETGISKSILKQVYNRGMAAWRTGHRPGTTPEQWGMARINSFATGGKTRTTADADLWAKHKGKSESFLDDAKALMEEVENFVGEAKGSSSVKPFFSFKTPDYSTPVSKKIKHTLGIGATPEHMRKAAVKNIDRDYDGDVDNQEMNTAVEFGGAEKQDMTKLIKKKMAGEREHTKRGLAFESVDKSDPKNREHGTDSLVKILKDDTPGQKNEAYFDAEITGSFGEFTRGSRVRFVAHSLDMADGEDAKEGTVVGSNVQHLRVRSDDGMLYKVRHKDAEMIREAMIVSEEFINFDILTENLLDKAVEAVRKHVTKGKPLEDVIWDFSVATGFKVPTRELYTHYVKTHGNPSAPKPVSADHKAALIRKYLGK